MKKEDLNKIREYYKDFLPEDVLKQVDEDVKTIIEKLEEKKKEQIDKITNLEKKCNCLSGYNLKKLLPLFRQNLSL